VLTVCMCKGAALRRTVEDRLSAAIPGSTPSYTLLPAQHFENIDSAKAALKQGNFDGAVVMHLISVEKTQTYVPGSPYVVPVGYRGLWGAWGFRRPLYGVAYDPGYVQSDELVNFDTNVYSVADGRLVWASRSQTDNPSSVQNLVNDVVGETVKAMRKQNLFT
jgi:hypothetical protein